MSENQIVERGVPLSQSFIWKLQCRFYESLGIDAWLSGVIPSKITTNSFIARTYAKLIAAYAADVGASQLRIIELGAGHGRFGFLCAQHLSEMARDGLLPVKDWKFVLTDVAERNIGFWQEHPAFRPLVKAGHVDFARYEAGVDDALRLRESGECLSTTNQAENLVVIGNYLFDSLPIDVWQADEGDLYDCRPVLSLPEDATCRDKADAGILEWLELDWSRDLVESAGYKRPVWNELVEYFRARLGEGTFTLPVGGFETLEQLDSWSKNGHMLLTADKGYARESDLIGRPLPTMVQHGCFSFSLNFCALGKWFEMQGGRKWLPDFRDGNLECAAFVKNSGKPALPALDRAYRLGPGEFSPGDLHQVVRRCAQTTPDLRACLSLVRLSAHEPQVLYHLRREIRSHIDSADSTGREAVRETLRQVSSRYFKLDSEDVLFAIGTIFQALKNYTEAAAHYRRSLEDFGEDPTVLHCLAEALAEAGETEEAVQAIRRAIELDPEYREAIEFANRIGADLPAVAVH